MVNNSDIKVSYRGNGQNINFPFSFPFFDADYICVKILDEITGNVTTLDSDYYVDTAGSKVIYPGYEPGTEPPEADRPPILPETSVLTIYRNTEVSQLIELGEKFPLPVIEKALDKITEILQEHKEEISRSVKVDITSTVTPDQLIEEIRNSTATAIEAKLTAVASAAAAEASEANAANSASSASASQQAAATSATAAAASAVAAAQSATDLETAVTTATTKAAEALASQQAAAASETNAANSASAAATSQQAAATSATAAATSATNASNSASAAAGSATSAAGSATEAAETAASIDHHAGYRQPSTNYSEGNMANNSGLPYGWYLECTTPGTTSASDLVITSPSVGDTVTDGTVTWTIRAVASTADIPAPVDIRGKANVDLDNLSAAGEQKIQSVSPRYLVDSYYNATTGNWWRKYSDGWVEQGGMVISEGTDADVTVSLLKAMSNDKYFLATSCIVTSNAGLDHQESMSAFKTKTTTGFTKYCYHRNSNILWIAVGKMA